MEILGVSGRVLMDVLVGVSGRVLMDVLVGVSGRVLMEVVSKYLSKVSKKTMNIFTLAGVRTETGCEHFHTTRGLQLYQPYWFAVSKF
jgi:hypothetical protein